MLRHIISAINTVTPTPVINSMSSLMSRLPICAISCAITPDSSLRSSFFIMPWVSATDASRGVRPVAKAFSELSSMIYTRGVGRPAARATFSTMRYISRCSLLSGDISCACAAPSIIESPNAHDINIHTKHTIIVGVATAIVVSMADSIGDTSHVNKNTRAMNINGNNNTSNAVLILLLRIWS